MKINLYITVFLAVSFLMSYDFALAENKNGSPDLRHAKHHSLNSKKASQDNLNHHNFKKEQNDSKIGRLKDRREKRLKLKDEARDARKEMLGNYRDDKKSLIEEFKADKKEIEDEFDKNGDGKLTGDERQHAQAAFNELRRSYKEHSKDLKEEHRQEFHEFLDSLKDTN